ncbi:MAG: M20 family peptidase, partial [Gemmatimonadota bacterium]
MKKILLFVLAGLVVLVGVLIARTARLTTRQIEVEPVTGIEVDEGVVAEHLAGALRFRTISHQDSTQFDGGAFRDFHAYLEETYPGVHRVCGREVVADYSNLFRCSGVDPSLSAVLLMAHIDVVPVQPGTEADWTYPPYAGEIADGYVWGRGAMDDKGLLIAILEAAELLIEGGGWPQRTVYLAFGHNEEIGGTGAAAIAELLASRGVELELVLDEGGVVTDVVPGVDRSVAVVGIAEKGFLSVELTVHTEGGHSSMPPPQTAVGILSAAIRELEAHPVPGGIRGATAAMFDFLGPEMSFGQRLFVANRWLFGPLIERQFGASREGAAMLRTTTAATIFQAGVKYTVLPASARAVVNFRVMPGDSKDSVVEHVRRTVDDSRVEVKLLGDFTEPSPVSDVESDAFARLQRTIGQVFPHAIVAPYLAVVGTDSRYYVELSRNVYRFGPLEVGSEDLRRIHGTDERVSVAGLADMVRF